MPLDKLPSLRNARSGRRLFLQQSASYMGLAAAASLGAPALVAAQSVRPQMPYGLQLGDTTIVSMGRRGFDRHDAPDEGEGDRGDGRNLQARSMVWARSDKPARMVLEWDTTDRFANPRRIIGPYALEATDFTARVDLTGLPLGQQLFTRVAMEDLGTGRSRSEWLNAQFRTPSLDARRGPRFVWGGDTAGQNFGINADFGGMRIYEQMRLRDPDFFVHCGDTIYADGAMTPTVNVEGGQVWKNLIAEGVEKVAETQDEFRGRYRYNLRDANIRKFALQVPQLWQWDDHEVTNNWSDSKDLSADRRYVEKSVPLLTARASRAFLEYAPLRPHTADDSERVYRKLSYGPLLEVFMIDMRSYRGPNTTNDQPTESPETAFLGNTQIDWLVQSLKASRSTWKVISADMPLSLVIGDGKDASGRDRFEGPANASGPARGRELEIGRLLSAIKRERIRNVVWITADVHYCAAHYYDPTKAQYSDFDPFWEFVAGPLNAGSFGPNALDNTFGPQLVFQKAPPAQNTSPLAGFQFFGEMRVDPRGRTLNVAFVDINGATVFARSLEPAHG
ncbi:alkaline phosphatase D family protein [Polaromonas sp.]|jgi:alkaline phosphatase D|uniref:alkaline phosphatase D family protein n=1 Tax=Polaromonas sp. TaxID=1869339 RepID=UPI002C030AB5|nr:alkaline phosphatase D family protein [Polaromonas sp.]HQS33360.1 alkaline phosphatase D family protein [Polaromonas sp.]HQS92627.1 alkaline phosphatase D family protein [Polaromonas sp.]